MPIERFETHRDRINTLSPIETKIQNSAVIVSDEIIDGKIFTEFIYGLDAGKLFSTKTLTEIEI